MSDQIIPVLIWTEATLLIVIDISSWLNQDRLRRVTALSLLPINDTTLRYGSSDAGKHVVANDDLLNVLMANAADTFEVTPPEFRETPRLVQLLSCLVISKDMLVCL